MEPEYGPRHPAPEPLWFRLGVEAYTGELQLRASPSNQPLTVEERNAILEDIHAGRDRRIVVDAVVFRQTEEPNRNFVRFKPTALKALAKSFTGQPFLRDHEQRDLEARGGKILESAFEGGEGVGAIHQTLELSAPWAVDQALRGLIDRFSIGWLNTGDVLCTACGAAYRRGWFGAYPSCDHMPGDKVVGKDDKVTIVEMLVTGAEGIETSAVSVPAVPGTGVDDVRSQLAASRVRATIAAHPPKEKSMKTFALIAAALSLGEDADEAAILKEIGRLQAEQAVHKQTKEALAAAQTKLEELESVSRASQLDALIDGAYREGKIAGERKDNAVEAQLRRMGSVDFAATKAFVENMPKVVPVGAQRGAGGDKGNNGAVLSAQQKRIAAAAGLTEVQFSAQLAKEV